MKRLNTATTIHLASAATGAVVMTQVETPNDLPLAADLAFGGMIGAMGPAVVLGSIGFFLVASSLAKSLLKFVMGGDH